MTDDRNPLQKLLDGISGEHHWGDGFDKAVCYGNDRRYPTPCPKLNDGAVDRCSECGCTIVGLDQAQAPPDGCPRLSDHTDD